MDKLKAYLSSRLAGLIGVVAVWLATLDLGTIQVFFASSQPDAWVSPETKSMILKGIILLGAVKAFLGNKSKPDSIPIDASKKSS